MSNREAARSAPGRPPTCGTSSSRAIWWCPRAHPRRRCSHRRRRGPAVARAPRGRRLRLRFAAPALQRRGGARAPSAALPDPRAAQRVGHCRAAVHRPAAPPLCVAAPRLGGGADSQLRPSGGGVDRARRHRRGVRAPDLPTRCSRATGPTVSPTPCADASSAVAETATGPSRDIRERPGTARGPGRTATGGSTLAAAD